MMSTAIREAATLTDDRPDETDTTTEPTHPTDPAERAGVRSESGPGAAPEGAGAAAHDVQAELATMLEYALRMLPRALLEPVVTASCPWYRDLPPAAARQCLDDLQEARRAGDVASVLLQWRRRALPFAT